MSRHERMEASWHKCRRFAELRIPCPYGSHEPGVEDVFDIDMPDPPDQPGGLPYCEPIRVPPPYAKEIFDKEKEVEEIADKGYPPPILPPLPPTVIPPIPGPGRRGYPRPPVPPPGSPIPVPVGSGCLDRRTGGDPNWGRMMKGTGRALDRIADSPRIPISPFSSEETKLRDLDEPPRGRRSLLVPEVAKTVETVYARDLARALEQRPSGLRVQRPSTPGEAPGP